MRPYYADDMVTLYNGRAEDVLPTLDVGGSVHLLTDPPYFQVKGDDWDNQWKQREHFLDWMGEWLDLAKPHLSPDASVWVFASPELTSEVERVVEDRFRVLNSVRWVKEHGWHKKAELDAARRFLTAWEGIVFAEQSDDRSVESDTLRGATLAPLGKYFLEACSAANRDIRDVAVALGYSDALGRFWGQGVRFPTEAAYVAMQSLLGVELLPRAYPSLRAQYDGLTAEFYDLRRPFALKNRHRSTDVWNFDNVAPYPGKHPCEKPLGLLTHMIETTTRPGDTLLDCFAGSGAILDAARKLGRRAVGIEMDAKWCKRAASRLGQQMFDLDWDGVGA